MALLRIYCQECREVEFEVEVHDVTTMGYAAMHVADAAGLDSDGGQWYLTTRGNQPINSQDLAADWDGKEVVLRGDE